jgi:uncharacterized protein
MAVDHIRYDILAQEALRGVVRKVLADAAKNGLPGEHHFFVSFDTRAEGVRLSPRMLAQYPEEMTVVLQHQFWDLVVTETAFEVGVSFGGIPERLSVPFAAVTGFLDPAVEFGLKFEDAVDAAADTAEESAPAGKDRAAKRPPAEHKGGAPAMLAVPEPANPEPADSTATETSSGGDADKPAAGGEVVRLDRFRKK